ncbi:hypothetical protein Pint_07239 [Pistacia integerrima]|uniref:Uncharacterized protein n=1 Tax=Pistacia integerrima TaxID=434235 RepID=A0ACC0XVH3_9ROSI|nr:hypothetical protein Pint_07239 [Pistacia integerrima]
MISTQPYIFNIELGLIWTKIKHWVELFFNVKIIAINSHQLLGNDKRMRLIIGDTINYIYIIIMLQPLRKKKFKNLNQNIYMAWLYSYIKLLPGIVHRSGAICT